MGRGLEPNLGIGKIAVCLAKLAHGYARARALEVETMKNFHSGSLDLSDVCAAHRASRGRAPFRGLVHSPR